MLMSQEEEDLMQEELTIAKEKGKVKEKVPKVRMPPPRGTQITLLITLIIGGKVKEKVMKVVTGMTGKEVGVEVTVGLTTSRKRSRVLPTQQKGVVV